MADTLNRLREVHGITDAELVVAKAQLETRQQAWELKQLRKKRGMTQKALAAAMDDAQNRVSQIERGGAEHIRLATLRRYAAALGGRLTVRISVDGEEYQIA